MQSLSLCAMHGEQQGLPPLLLIWLPSLNVGRVHSASFILYDYFKGMGDLPRHFCLSLPLMEGGFQPVSI